MEAMKVDTKSAYQLADRDKLIGERETEYVLRVRDLPLDEKPREKLSKLGPSNLTMAELVAILLGVGTKKEEVLSMAQRILRDYGESAIINETSPQRLASALDIPLVKACQLIAGFEIGRRYFDKRAEKSTYIHTPAQAYEYLRGISAGHKEQLRGLYLNSRYQVIHDEVISVGSLTANIVHPREVFQPAIEHGAVAILIAHNHPSGSLEPTVADNQVTKQLKEAGTILGIDLLDHLIITHNKYISIIEEE
jgi:DNA repair protein RadC